MNAEQNQQQFARNGYVKLDNFFTLCTLSFVKQAVEVFHHAWCVDNHDFYTNRAINSAGLTSGQYMTEEQRLSLFKLISDSQLLKAVSQIIPMPLFMGSQLFFNPFKPKQNNYWYRDPQYHLSVNEQNWH